MENHPIPQDVTGFQFKLIGEMTVKQFGLLAAGVIMGWIFLNFPASLIIRLPLAFVFFGMGIAFAFIPIEGRALDTMVLHFIKALFSPNQYIYKKLGGTLLVSTVLPKPSHTPVTTPKDQSEKLKIFLQALPKKPKNKLDEKELSFFQSISVFTASPFAKGQALSPKPNIITMEEEKSRGAGSGSARQKEEEAESAKQPESKEELEKESALLQKELQEAKTAELQQKTPDASFFAHQKVKDLEQQLREIQSQKQQLEEQLLQLQQRLMSTQAGYVPTTAGPKAETQNVRKISKDMGKSVGLPIAPEAPNLLTGIIKDSRGNMLPNILVEVRDKDGNPARAFKTNPLGQFASATSLLNGTYIVTFEDTRGEHTFDTVELIANGAVIEPIEVISKDMREDLRKALFGGT